MLTLHATLRELQNQHREALDSYYTARAELMDQLEMEREQRLKALDQKLSSASSVLQQIEDLTQTLTSLRNQLLDVLLLRSEGGQSFLIESDKYKLEKQYKYKRVAKLTKKSLIAILGKEQGETVYERSKVNITTTELVISPLQVDYPIVVGGREGEGRDMTDQLDDVAERPPKRLKKQ